MWGPDAPTPAREWDLPSHGVLTLFFRWRKKSVQKKASGTATPGKRLLLPILTAGLAMSRAAWLARFRMLSCALGARLFPPPKWAGLFPSAAYRRSAPPQVALGRLKGKPVGMLRRNLAGFAAKKQACFFTAVDAMFTQSALLGMLRRGLDILVTQKASGILYPRWSLLRAMRPVAEWRSFLFN